MTNQELQERLQKLPPEARVVCDGQDGDIADILLVPWIDQPTIEIVAGGPKS